MTDLHAMTATEALGRFRDRSLSPVELMEATIARAEATEPTVNAFAHTSYEAALEQARAAEERYAGTGEAPRALEGLALSVKEEEALDGQPWTQGSLLFKDTVADYTSAFGQRILDSGAIVHARTTAPEFSCAGFTHSRLNGVTRNPWGPDWGVGGSSGGAGASLAAGSSILSSGSDIGGSIRLPASFCGVVGFKAPYGRVPVDPPFNLDTFCHCGALARTVADTALFENVIAGPHPADHATLRPKLELPPTFEGVAGLRIALSVDFGTWPLDPEVRANTLACAEALRAAGATVEEVDISIDRVKLKQAAAVHYQHIFTAWIAAQCAAHPDEVTAYAAALGPEMTEVAGDLQFIDGLMLEHELHAPVGAVLDRYDALICPTAATRGLRAGDDYVGHGIEVGGELIEHYFDAFFTPVFNVLSRCPVLNVPSGFGENGIPTGLQIVGRTYDDLTTFRIGAALERERPWPTVAELAR